MITAEKKTEIIKTFGKSENDTGSAEVQIALLTYRINDLQTHFKTHTKDHHSRRGLLALVNSRRKHLDYLKKNALKRYQDVIVKLGLRK
ncbi:MAG: 30S ribosomal protein S15 [Ostreibacterium sp.]